MLEAETADEPVKQEEPDPALQFSDAMSALADALFGGTTSTVPETDSSDETEEEAAPDDDNAIVNADDSAVAEVIAERIDQQNVVEDNADTAETHIADEPVTKDMVETLADDTSDIAAESVDDVIDAEACVAEIPQPVADVPADAGSVAMDLPAESFEDAAAMEEIPGEVSEVDVVLTEETPNPEQDVLHEPEAETITDVAVDATEEYVSIPEDGRLTAKECRRVYRDEIEWHMPAGYREIRAGACAALEKLEILHIADTVEKICSGAFADCSDLRAITIPLSVTALENDAFDGCDTVTNITAPEVMREQIVGIFGETVQYTWLPEPPKIIGDGKFTAKIRNSMYNGETELIIPEGYIEIRAGACAGLEELEQVILPATLEKIAAGAFADCIALQSVTIPDRVTVLADDAFEGCTALKRIVAPKHLETVIRTNFPNVLVLFTEFA